MLYPCSPATEREQPVTKRTILLSWGSGKDSAWSLHVLRQDSAIELRGLFTVVNQAYARASMHATRLERLRRQADAASLPLEIISLPDRCTMERTNEIMGASTAKSRADGIECMAFGDLYNVPVS
jgi:diphthamide synthase (EF-2-diphthine--ammonia ligase)